MKFTELDLRGAYIIECEERSDARGYFARTYCHREFAEHGLDFTVVQSNRSGNAKAGTTRGMHFQQRPNGEIKLVSCVRGSVFDCIVDVRADSPTYLRHVSVILQEGGPMLYIPAGFAHGYQTLEDGAVVEYMVGAFYATDSESGLRWNDPLLNIDWPIKDNVVVSAKDATIPLLPRKGGFIPAHQKY